MWNILTSQAWQLYTTLVLSQANYDADRIARAIIRAHARARRREQKAWAGWMRYTNGNYIVFPNGFVKL